MAELTWKARDWDHNYQVQKKTWTEPAREPIRNLLCRHDNINYQCSEMLQLFTCGINRPPKLEVFVLHEEVPRQINRVLFGNALVVVQCGKSWTFADECWIWNSRMVHVVDQRWAAECKKKEGRGEFSFRGRWMFLQIIFVATMRRCRRFCQVTNSSLDL